MAWKEIKCFNDFPVWGGVHSSLIYDRYTAIHTIYLTLFVDISQRLLSLFLSDKISCKDVFKYFVFFVEGV